MVDNNQQPGRRSFIKSGALAISGLGAAGCIGNSGNDGETTLQLVTSDETSASFAAGQGLASVINENSDQLSLNVSPSSGTRTTPRLLAEGEADLAFTQNWTTYNIRDGKEPFDELSLDPRVVMHYSDVFWVILAAEGENWEVIGDIEEGSTISPGTSGSLSQETMTRVLDYTLDDYDTASMALGDQSGAFAEGRIDVGIGTIVNQEIVPGWTQQILSEANSRVLDLDEDTLNHIENDDFLDVSSLDTSGMDNASYNPGEVMATRNTYKYITRDDMSEETIYEFISTMFEHRESLGDHHNFLEYYKNPEFFVKNPFQGVPYHQAAKDFYQEEELL